MDCQRATRRHRKMWRQGMWITRRHRVIRRQGVRRRNASSIDNVTMCKYCMWRQEVCRHNDRQGIYCAVKGVSRHQVLSKMRRQGGNVLSKG